MTTTPATVTVIGGVDTHKHTHYAAAIDDQGRLLGHQDSRPTTPATSRCWPGCEATGRARDRRGKHRLLRSHPDPGAHRAGERVVEVNRPNRMRGAWAG